MIDPNTLDLNYFYSNYINSYRIIFDKENSSNIQPILANFRLMDCIIKALCRNTKTTHFIKAPSTTAITFYLCDKYHTNFIIFSKTILNPTKPTNFTTFTASTTNKKTKIILDNLNKITQFIPLSPTPIFYEHTCKKCWLAIRCKIINNQHYLSNNTKFEQGEAIHHSCTIATTSATSSSSSIATTSSLGTKNLDNTGKNLTATFKQTL